MPWKNLLFHHQDLPVWRDAFVTRWRVTEGGLLGYLCPASWHYTQVLPNSEVLVLGHTWVGPQGSEYCVVEQCWAVPPLTSA